jgi:hypothetical protein
MSEARIRESGFAGSARNISWRYLQRQLLA